jgi:hypothetical protein
MTRVSSRPGAGAATPTGPSGVLVRLKLDVLSGNLRVSLLILDKDHYVELPLT